MSRVNTAKLHCDAQTCEIVQQLCDNFTVELHEDGVTENVPEMREKCEVVCEENIEEGNVPECGNKSVVMEYKTLPLINTRCYVVFVKDCLNLDIDYELTEEQREKYSQCIQNEYTYAEMDGATLELEAPKVGVAYRSRLRGISSCGKKYRNSKHPRQMAMVKATIDVINSVMMTSGFFRCELGDIDIFNRILVTLFDPLTGKSLNSEILENYASVFSEYGVEQAEFHECGGGNTSTGWRYEKWGKSYKQHREMKYRKDVPTQRGKW